MASSVQLYNTLQKQTDLLFKKLGMSAVLRRVGSDDRSCLVVLSSFTPMEKMGGLVNPLDVKAMVSAKGLTIPPDHEKDRLVTFVPGTNPPTEDSIYRIMLRPSPLAPAGVVLLYELTVRKP